MSKSKAQGTKWETYIVARLNRRFLRGRRLPELGANDEGDIEFFDSHDKRWVIEAKATQSLNVTRVLGKAKAKSRGDFTVLFWKRIVPTEGKKIRQADGEKEVVVKRRVDCLYLVRR